MTSNQEKLDYVVSPQFKADNWNGGSDQERAARVAFMSDLLHYRLPLGADGETISIAQFLRWQNGGIDTVFRAVVANGAKLDALISNVAAVGAGDGFDAEKFLDDVEARVRDAMKEGLTITIN